MDSMVSLGEVVDDEDLLLKKAVVIPEKELWLLKDPENLKSIHRGIEDAKSKRLHKVDPKEFDV